MWHNWDTEKPPLRAKIIIVCDDGMSSGTAYVSLSGNPLDAEDGAALPPVFMNGAIWAHLPDDYPIAFMEADPYV